MPSRAPPVCVLERGQRGGAAFFYSITQGQEADNHLLLEKISKTAKKCLTKFSPGGIINKLIENSTIQDALVAQLDRVTGYEPVGRGFESLRAHQINGLTMRLLSRLFFCRFINNRFLGFICPLLHKKRGV